VTYLGAARISSRPYFLRPSKAWRGPEFVHRESRRFGKTFTMAVVMRFVISGIINRGKWNQLASAAFLLQALAITAFYIVSVIRLDVGQNRSWDYRAGGLLMYLSWLAPTLWVARGLRNGQGRTGAFALVITPPVLIALGLLLRSLFRLEITAPAGVQMVVDLLLLFTHVVCLTVLIASTRNDETRNP